MGEIYYMLLNLSEKDAKKKWKSMFIVDKVCFNQIITPKFDQIIETETVLSKPKCFQ